MTLRKDAPPVRAVSSAASSPARRGPSVGARLFILLVEIPPAAYVAVTGTVPTWVRVWLAAWLTLWAVVTLVAGVKAGARDA
jgi:hypothetical protein